MPPSDERDSWLEPAAAALALAIAAWTVVTTVLAIRAGYSPLPFWDEWDRWRTYLTLHYSAAWFFRQHNEHRLAAPGVLFAIDHLAFRAREWFLLVCTFCLQAALAAMVWRLARRASGEDRRGLFVLGAATVTCLFSAQQYVNFIWGFQVQFALLLCGAVGALMALSKGGGRWIAASILLAVLATYSMSNGVLVWPVLLLTARWLRAPRKYGAGIAVAGALIALTYFYGWHRVSESANPLASVEAGVRVVNFWLVHLGSPAAAFLSLIGDPAFVANGAAMAGSLVLLAAAGEFAMLWLYRDRHNGAQAVLIHAGVFLAGSSLAMAIGRSGMMQVNEAYTSRYLTPAYLLWVCLLAAAWPWARRVGRRVLYGLVCALLLAGIGMEQMAALRTVRDWMARFRLGEVAVVDGVVDPGAWSAVFHTPKLALESVAYLKQNRLSVFTEEWTHWPGIPLDRRFSIDRNPNACQGGFEEAMAVESSLRGGWRVSGWAWDVKEKRPPEYVILGDDAGLVAGVGLTGFPEEAELAALSAKYTAGPWYGYVSGEPRRVTAYILESDQRSLCAIGSRTVRPPGGEVSFTRAGETLGAAAVQITGSWTTGGYYPQVGRPPVDGAVFGSWSGADGNTGTIEWGPIHLDGRTQMVVPLVTGPANHGLAVRIRDAASKETLAELSPPPVRTAWWGWVPELPSGREMNVEIVGEDRGRGFGEWQAIGWPHALLEAPRPGRGMPPATGASLKLTRSDLEAVSVLDYIGPVGNPASQSLVQVAGDKGVTFSGWAIDEAHKAPAAGVDVVIDEVPYSAHYGVERVDVAGHFHNDAFRNAGFEWTAGPGQLTAGAHSVSLRVIASGGYSQGPTMQFTVKY